MKNPIFRLYRNTDKWHNIPKMKDQTATIIENTVIQNNYRLLKIQADFISSNAKPGNFVMIRVSSSLDPLLKRPFGIFDAVPPFIWIYYQVVGRGTRIMSGLSPGDRITILGPLGNAFPSLQERNILGIAGGRGIAPIHFALKVYAAQNQVTLVYGARSRSDLNLVNRLRELDLKEMVLYTDDGSTGKKGSVTMDIQNLIRQYHIEVSVSCGPDPMFREIFQLTREIGIKSYISMESLMGCGFGVCQSCVVPTRESGYQKVCSDGPVFDIKDIAW